MGSRGTRDTREGEGDRVMNAQLKAGFTDEERAEAAEIGASEATITAKAEELFGLLSDPLLSARDVKELLGIKDSMAKVRAALGELVENGTVEKDEETQRPFDKEGTVLYRCAGREH